MHEWRWAFRFTVNYLAGWVECDYCGWRTNILQIRTRHGRRETLAAMEGLEAMGAAHGPRAAWDIWLR